MNRPACRFVFVFRSSHRRRFFVLHTHPLPLYLTKPRMRDAFFRRRCAPLLFFVSKRPRAVFSSRIRLRRPIYFNGYKFSGAVPPPSPGRQKFFPPFLYAPGVFFGERRERLYQTAAIFFASAFLIVRRFLFFKAWK